MAEYRAFVAKLNTEKDADLIAFLENQTGFVDWVRRHVKSDLQHVGAGTIAPTDAGTEPIDLAAFAHITRAVMESVIDQRLKGAILATGTGDDDDQDLDAELGDRFDSMDF